MRPGERLVVLGLGANVGGASAIVERFRRALEDLASGPLQQIRRAPLYLTTPVPPGPQPDFVNTVISARLGPELEPGPEAIRRLVGLGKELEARAGRDLGAKVGGENGPRPLDVDLLLLGPLRLRLPAVPPRPGGEGPRWCGPIEVPHPRMTERLFVLRPLADLLPGRLVLPLGPRRGDEVTTVTAALERARRRHGEQQRVERLDDGGAVARWLDGPTEAEGVTGRAES